MAAAKNELATMESFKIVTGMEAMDEGRSPRGNVD